MEEYIFDIKTILRLFKNIPDAKLIDGYLVLLEEKQIKQAINYICIKKHILKKKPKKGQIILFFRCINDLNEAIPDLSKELKLYLFCQGYKTNETVHYINKNKHKFCAYGNCINLKKNKKCANCERKYYCCKRHQKIDWNTKHRYDCN